MVKTFLSMERNTGRVIKIPLPTPRSRLKPELDDIQAAESEEITRKT